MVVVVVDITIITIFVDAVLVGTDRGVISLLITTTTSTIIIIIIVVILHLIVDLRLEEVVVAVIKEIVVVHRNCAGLLYHSGGILHLHQGDLENVLMLFVIAGIHQIEECRDLQYKEGKVLHIINNSSNNHLHSLIDGHLHQYVVEPIAIHQTGIVQQKQLVHQFPKGIIVQDVLPLHLRIAVLIDDPVQVEMFH